jgi:1-acyl-sn-glycerol-3-phosphate acyltransferase
LLKGIARVKPPVTRLRYPRRRLLRHILRFLAQLLLRLLVRVEIVGKENFPKQGPLLLIANHIDSSDGVFMALCTPYLAETMIAADLPFPRVVRWLLALYGHIPVYRGSADGSATRQALSVLEQGGMVILFPEGAIWRAAGKEIHTGGAWLSQKAQAPILPIGLVGTRGAFPKAFTLKRPSVTLHIGAPLAPITPTPEHDKAHLQQAANAMMSAVEALIPPSERQQTIPFDRMTFGFTLRFYDAAQQEMQPAPQLTPEHIDALGKVYYDLALMTTLVENNQLPVQALVTPHQPIDRAALDQALHTLFTYLDHEYAHFFSYRFGKAQGAQMRAAFEQWQQMIRHSTATQISFHPSAVLRDISA